MPPSLLFCQHARSENDVTGTIGNSDSSGLLHPMLSNADLPRQPWEEVAVDQMGPLPSDEHLLVLVDYYSRWMEVDVIRSTTSKTIIHCLNAQFARHGLPRGLRTDNGPNLVSKKVEEYLNEMGIEHHYTTPLWPRANGEVER